MTETQLQKSGAHGKFQEFCSETTAHGFGRLASASSAIERLLWLVCLLAALTYTIVQGFYLVSEYFSYPVEVKVEMKHREDLEFPAIVICNMNAMRKQALNEVVEEGQVTVSICLITALTSSQCFSTYGIIVRALYNYCECRSVFWLRCSLSILLWVVSSSAVYGLQLKNAFLRFRSVREED